jgi:hypothetical protein
LDAENSTSVPRHREIAYPLARAIRKHLGIPPPEGSLSRLSQSCAAGIG